MIEVVNTLRALQHSASFRGNLCACVLAAWRMQVLRVRCSDTYQPRGPREHVTRRPVVPSVVLEVNEYDSVCGLRLCARTHNHVGQVVAVVECDALLRERVAGVLQRMEKRIRELCVDGATPVVQEFPQRLARNVLHEQKVCPALDERVPDLYALSSHAHHPVQCRGVRDAPLRDAHMQGDLGVDHTFHVDGCRPVRHVYDVFNAFDHRLASGECAPEHGTCAAYRHKLLWITVETHRAELSVLQYAVEEQSIHHKISDGTYIHTWYIRQ